MSLSNLSSILYGFTDMKTLNERGPLVLSYGKNIYVYDIHNNKYMDANSGLWNCVAGFDHPGLVETAIQQYKKFAGYHSLFGRLTDTAVQLADKLIEISPFNAGRVFYTNSGSEANDTAVKILWMLNKRKGKVNKRKIITRLNAYHGVTIGASSMTGKPYNEEFGMPLNDFIHTDNPHYWKHGNSNETEVEFSERLGKSLEDLIIHQDPETIAGFFAEPVMGAGGVIPPPKNYFNIIQPILKKYNIPFIVDEVICGFGRTGNLWGLETYNIDPDMIIVYDGWNDIQRPFDKYYIPGEFNEINNYIRWIVKNDVIKTGKVILKSYFSWKQDNFDIDRNFDATLIEEKVDSWKKTWIKTCEVSKEKKIDMLILLQPILGSSNRDLSEHELSNFEFYHLSKLTEQYRNYYESLTDLNDHCSEAIDFRNLFDGYGGYCEKIIYSYFNFILS